MEKHITYEQLKKIDALLLYVGIDNEKSRREFYEGIGIAGISDWLKSSNYEVIIEELQELVNEKNSKYQEQF